MTYFSPNTDYIRRFQKLASGTILGGTLFLGSVSWVAAADVTTNFSGTLDGSTTYTRPVTVTGPASGWIPGGTTYNYFTEQFTPSGTGDFDINVLGTSTINDPVLYLYSGSFDPSNPLVNGVIANDDSGGNLMPKITAQTLTGGDNIYYCGDVI